jgi:hypothetical protein
VVQELTAALLARPILASTRARQRRTSSLDSTITSLTRAGARFRNDIEVGPGGKQILVDDPDGNPVELHEAPHR